jgi:diguanylate cyclase (GGDEF)-like protein
MAEMTTSEPTRVALAGLMRAAASRPPAFFDRKLEGHRNFTIAMMCALGPMAASMWVWDHVVDPAGAHNTIVLRMLSLFLGFIPAAIFIKARNRLVLQKGTLAGLLGAVFIFSLITTRLTTGSLYGIGGYMFFPLAVILVCQGFSAPFGMTCAIVAGTLPHLLGVVGFLPDFPHLQYAVLIWPAVGMSCVALLALSYNYGAFYDTRLQLELVSAIDPLTEAANRRLFMPLLEKELARSRRFGHALSLLMIDIDEFKKINDRLGHPVGDVVLKQLADTCRSAIRKSDTLARLGGDEFAVLLPESDAAGALELAETIRAAVEASPALGADGHVVRYTVSVGAVEARVTDVMDTNLIGRADEALLRGEARWPKPGTRRVASGSSPRVEPAREARSE